MTSMHIDSEKQAAIKIQAIGRGVSSRKVTFEQVPEALPSSEVAMAWLVAAVLVAILRCGCIQCNLIGTNNSTALRS